MMPPPARNRAAGPVPRSRRMKVALASLARSLAGARLAGATASAQTVYKSIGADG